MTDQGGEDATLSYTMRELNQQTAEVMKSINESGRPAVITRHGRQIAVVVPVADAALESAIVETVLTSTLGLDGIDRPVEGRLYTLDEAAKELGIALG